jgi:putative serine protease PepD
MSALMGALFISMATLCIGLGYYEQNKFTGIHLSEAITASQSPLNYYNSVLRIEKGKMIASGVYLGEGRLLTANHVSSEAGPGDFEVVSVGKAKVIWSNPATELGLLKIEGFDGPTAELDCSTGDAAIGDELEAIGNGFGFEKVHTYGRIATDTRTYPEIDTVRTLQIANMVLAPGMSGGGVFHNGKLVGITSAMIGPAGSGMGFIVPKSVICKDLTSEHPKPELPKHGPVVGGSLKKGS